MEFRYRGLKGTLEHVEVTEKELDARLMQLQQQHPCVKTVTDRAAKAGDELVNELQMHVKHETAPYKYPRIIEFVDELPKTISGKIRRVEIREKDKK